MTYQRYGNLRETVEEYLGDFISGFDVDAIMDDLRDAGIETEEDFEGMDDRMLEDILEAHSRSLKL